MLLRPLMPDSIEQAATWAAPQFKVDTNAALRAVPLMLCNGWSRSLLLWGSLCCGSWCTRGSLNGTSLRLCWCGGWLRFRGYAMFLSDAKEATFGTVSRPLGERRMAMRAQSSTTVIAELLTWRHLRVANRAKGYSWLHVITVPRLSRCPLVFP